MKLQLFLPALPYPLIMLSLLLQFANSATAHAQTTYFPARGIFNGFLEQINILECDNNGNSPVDLALTITANNGSQLGQLSFNLQAFGSRHIILNDLANIKNTYGTFSLQISNSQQLLGDGLHCRTAFYRNKTDGQKQFEYAYVLPVQNPQVGTLSGIYNSYDPAAKGSTTYNWLSVVNFDQIPLNAVVEVYSTAGLITQQLPISNLPPGGRIDLPLGHPSGETTGLYVIRPVNSLISYDAFLIRYNAANTGGFNFAFPLRAISGSCSGEPLLASTMGNGATDNWLEIANANPVAITVGIEVRDRLGSLLHQESRSVPAFGQNHVYLSTLIDPTRTGNVGSVKVLCSDPNDKLIVQSSYYGHVGTGPVEWAYSTQSRSGSSAGKNASLGAPVNTFVGMANWLKIASSSTSVSTINATVYDQSGQPVSEGASTLPPSATIDLGVHEMIPADQVGSIVCSSDTADSSYNGEILRVLSRIDGQIGNIISIPALVQQLGIPGSENTGFKGDPQSLAPYRDQLTDEESMLLLTRTVFGGSLTDLQVAKQTGLTATVNRLTTDLPDEVIQNEATNWFDGDEEPDTEPVYYQWYGIRRWWLHTIRYTPNPLRERMSLILHDLFATSCRVIDNGSEEIKRCLDHVQTLRAESYGNFRRLLKAMTVDYAMLVWLSNNMNRKEEPNENYAREHWELFSVGEAVKEGGRFLRYKDEDIKEAARAFTGWTTDYVNDSYQSIYVPQFHDGGLKTLWRGTPYEVSGRFDWEDITDLTLDHRPEAAQYLARRLFVAFVHDHPSTELINQMAEILKRNDYEILPLLRAILRSEAMFSADSRHHRVKDPITYLIGFLRRTGINFRIDRLDYELSDLAMEVTNPPDVNGWPGNKFKKADQTDYYLAWAPQYANSITEVLRHLVDYDDGSNDLFRFLPSSGATGEQVVDHLLKLMDIQPTDDERATYIQYMNTRLDFNGNLIPRTFDPNSSQRVREKVAGLLWILSQHEQFTTY